MSAFEIESRITREIRSGERLLWSGHPRQGLILRPVDAILIPFSLMWGGFAIFWEVTVIRNGAPFFFALFGIPFVLAGLYLIVGRFFADARQRQRTIYAVTNERVIIIVKDTVKSLNLKTIPEISLMESRDGNGTIFLGPTWRFGSFSAAGWPGKGRQELPPMLEGIPSARVVYETIQRAQKSLS